jgi:hypothetical protein
MATSRGREKCKYMALTPEINLASQISPAIDYLLPGSRIIVVLAKIPDIL